MKKLVFLLVMVLALSRPSVVLADEVCTTVYGGGVVCGAEAPEHKPVETGIEDYPLYLALGLLGSGFILYRLSKKIAL